MSPSISLSINQKGFGAIFLLVALIIIIALAGGGYYFYTIRDNRDQVIQRQNKYTLQAGNKVPQESGESANLSNPASEYCIKVGGDLEAKQRGDGGEYNICNFEDNRSCEEWALYRRDCPGGGIKTTGSDTSEQIYCALLGGKTTADPNASCRLPNGKTCSNSDLYNGKCQ